MRRAASPIPLPVVVTDLDHAVEFQNQQIDRSLFLQGKFKDEIERLTKVKEEAQEKLGMVATVEEAAKIKAEADEYATKAKTAADAVSAVAAGVQKAAEALREDVLLRERHVVNQEKSLTARESMIVEAQDKNAARAKELDRIEAERNEKHAATVKQLDAKLAEHRAEIAKGNAALAAREKRLNERLEALKLTEG